MSDPAAFSSEQLPTEHFDTRFSTENVAFWAPLLVDVGEIKRGHRVLDLGCGTGGFARAIAEAAAAVVTGVERSSRFIAFAEAQPAPRRGEVIWVVGDAGEKLPFDDGAFDRVLLSLILHQLRDAEAAVAETFRVLADGGKALVRTIAPEDVVRRIPERFAPSMAAADAARLPSVASVERWLVHAGFELEETRRVVRNQRLDFQEEESQLRVETQSRYAFIPAEELDAAIERMRADAVVHGAEWIDPRPAYFIRGSILVG